GLATASQAGDRVVRHEPILQVQQVNGLPASVLIVLVGPPGERIQVVVDQLTGKINRLPGHLDVLVHPAVLALPVAVTEQAQHAHGKHSAITNEAALESHPATKMYTIDFRAER